MTPVIAFLVHRPLVVNLISLFLIALGIFTITQINREAFPNVNLDTVRITFQYPGASPEEIENLVITPIEQELKTLDGIDKMTSTAFPGSGKLDLELDPYAPNRDRIASEVQLAVDRARIPNDLPDEPLVIEVDGRKFPIIQLAVSRPGPEIELKRIVDRIEDDLITINGVADVQIEGDRRSEMRVILDPMKLSKHDLTIGHAITLLSNWNVNAPGGEIDTDEGQKVIRVVGEFQSPADVEQLRFFTNELGQEIKLGDVATVVETLEKPRTYFDMKGVPAFNLIVLKSVDGDIIEVVDSVKQYLKTVPKKYGQELKVTDFKDYSRFTRMRLGVLTNNGIVGIILVLITLAIFLRPSVAITTTISLPIVFFAGLYTLYAFGITLNLVSMLGFIMVLGMLVDDAIIIGENITYHLEQGEPPVKAAINGTTELIGPVTTTILTTVVAFVPLLYMSGMIGKFIVAIPTVVITLLIFSWLEAFLILPSHINHFARANAHPKERPWLNWLENSYVKTLSFAIHHYWITIGISILILIGSLFLARACTQFSALPCRGYRPVHHARDWTTRHHPGGLS